jgi:putative PIG3 family NAD(P)H quinone oxidoreductase
MPNLPNSMRAIIAREPGGPEVLQIVERPLPAVGDDEVLVKTAAAGLNRPDILQRVGKYPMPPGAGDILGLEAAGEIAQIGNNVRDFKVGDKVCALLIGGGYAEYVSIPQGQVLLLPKNFTMEQAAALPETFFTVWYNLFMQGKLQAGETVLIHGGTSGIGTTAIQLAKAFGAQVIATAGGEDKRKACEKLGADLGVDYKAGDFVDSVRAKYEDVDVILDMVAGDYFPKNLGLLKKRGRLIQIAFLRGAKVELPLDLVMRQQLTIMGSMLRSQPVGEKARIRDELRAKVWPLLDQGKIKPVLDKVFPFDQVQEAHRHLESNTHIGKIVLRIE